MKLWFCKITLHAWQWKSTKVRIQFLCFPGYILHLTNYWIDIFKCKSPLLPCEGHCRFIILLFSWLYHIMVWNVHSILKPFYRILSLYLHIFWKKPCSAEDYSKGNKMVKSETKKFVSHDIHQHYLNKHSHLNMYIKLCIQKT